MKTKVKKKKFTEQIAEEIAAIPKVERPEPPPKPEAKDHRRFFESLHTAPYFDRNHREYRQGETVMTEDGEDLVKKFANKFREVFPSTHDGARKLASGEITMKEAKAGTRVHVAAGIDVTKDFPNEKNLSVFLTGTTFTVKNAVGKILLETDDSNAVTEKMNRKKKKKSRSH